MTNSTTEQRQNPKTATLAQLRPVSALARLRPLGALILLAAALSTAAPLAVRSRADQSPDLARGDLGGTWTTFANGDRVSALLREGDVLWSATASGGIVRWDLASGAYRQFLAPQHGLPANDVRAILRTRAGTLWAATAKGLAWLDEPADRWVPVAVDHPGLASPSATALAEAPDGKLWVGFEQRWDGEAEDGAGDTRGAFVGGGLAGYDPRSGAWGPVFRAETTGRRGEQYATIPSDNVTALAVTADGLLWVGTRPYFVRDEGDNRSAALWLKLGGGLAATDGQAWRQWWPSGGQEICLAGQINGLAADAAGQLWVATAGRGLQVFRNGLATEPCDFQRGHVTYLRLRGADRDIGIPDNFVWSVAIGADGRVWTGVGRGFDEGLGLAVLDHHGTFEDPSRPWESDDVWTAFGLDGRSQPVGAIVSALSVSGDEVLAGTQETDNLGDGWGIKRRGVDGSWRTYATAADGLPSNRITAVAVHPTSGDVWLGTATRGVARWDGERWHHWRAFETKASVASLAADAAAGQDAVTVALNRAAFGQAFPGPLPLVRFGADPTLYIIVGTQNAPGGVRVQVQPPLVMPLTADAAVHPVERGPASDVITAIAVGRDGRTWVGGRQTTWLGSACPPDRLSRGECWLDGGLSVFDGRGWTLYSHLGSDLPATDVQSLAVDRDGRVWVGTGDPRQGRGRGLAVYDPGTGRWTAHGAEQGLGPGGVAAIMVEPGTGDVWTANHAVNVCEPDGSGGCVQRQRGGGVARWDGAAWTVWSKAGGAPLLAFGDDGDFTAILVDTGRDRVWAGAWAADSGGFHWNSGVGIRTALNGCPRDCRNEAWASTGFASDGPVTALAVDERGRLWVAASRDRNGIIPQSTGLRILTGEAWFGLDAGHSPLPDDDVTALMPYGAAVWIGTLDRGAAIWRQMTPVDHDFLPLVGR